MTRKPLPRALRLPIEPAPAALDTAGADEGRAEARSSDATARPVTDDPDAIEAALDALGSAGTRAEAIVLVAAHRWAEHMRRPTGCPVCGKYGGTHIGGRHVGGTKRPPAYDLHAMGCMAHRGRACTCHATGTV